MTVYKLRRKSDGYFYNKTNGWVQDLQMGEPFRTKQFASNAAKRLIKNVYAYGSIVAKDNVEIVEFAITEIETYGIV